MVDNVMPELDAKGKEKFKKGVRLVMKGERVDNDIKSCIERMLRMV